MYKETTKQIDKPIKFTATLSLVIVGYLYWTVYIKNIL